MNTDGVEVPPVRSLGIIWLSERDAMRSNAGTAAGVAERVRGGGGKDGEKRLPAKIWADGAAA